MIYIFELHSVVWQQLQGTKGGEFERSVCLFFLFFPFVLFAVILKHFLLQGYEEAAEVFCFLSYSLCDW